MRRSKTARGSSSGADEQHFHRHCRDGNLQKVSQTLKKGGTGIHDLLQKRVGVYGYTPLHEAASYGHDEILDVSNNVSEL